MAGYSGVVGASTQLLLCEISEGPVVSVAPYRICENFALTEKHSSKLLVR